MPRPDDEPEYRRRITEKAKYQQQDAKNSEWRAQQNSDRQKIITAIQTFDEHINSYAKEQKSAEKRRSSRDRRQWWLDFAGVLGLWGAAAVGIGAILQGTADFGRQRGVMSNQLIAMKSQAEIMRGQLASMEIAQRPWLAVADMKITSPLAVKNMAASTSVDTKLINVGHTPARFEFVPTLVGQFWERQKGAPLCGEEIGRAYIQIKMMGQEATNEWTTIFPNRQISQNTISMIHDPIGSEREGGEFHVRLLACILYQFVNDTKIYSTGLLRDILHSVPDTTPSAHFMDDSITPVEQIRWGVVIGQDAD